MELVVRRIFPAGFAALFVFSLYVGARVGAAAAPPARISTGSHPGATSAATHGLEITVSVPRTSYPVGSLIRATITVKDLTHHAVRVVHDTCTSMVTRIEYSWPLPNPSRSCPAVMPSSTLGAGRAMTLGSVLYLRSPSLRPIIYLLGRGRAVSVVVGKPLRLSVTPAESEHAALMWRRGSNAGPAASIWPAPKNHGKLYYAQWEGCVGQRAGIGGGPTYAWRSSTGSSVHPLLLRTSTCPRLLEWHVIAGWLGHTAARLDLKVSAT